MENQTFGTTSFYHIPADLFASTTALDADGNKTITIKPTEPQDTNSSLVTVCVTYNHCLGTGPCAGGTCDQCNLCVTIDCTTIGPGGGGCTTIYCGGTGGGGTGGGGTGGGGGSGGGDTPCSFSGGSWYNNIVSACGGDGS